MADGNWGRSSDETQDLCLPPVAKRLRSDSGTGPGMAPMGSMAHTIPLPRHANKTLFVVGMPANCTIREISHIFRQFVGFQEVRLVPKGNTVLCFVDFICPRHAATAMDSLEGYKFDEHDYGSRVLKIEFAHPLGPTSSGGSSYLQPPSYSVGIRKVGAMSRDMGCLKGKIPLPSYASNTLLVRGLPTDCSRREVSHMFRQLEGFKEVRIVRDRVKGPHGLYPPLQCFVDFIRTEHAAAAMDDLEGYIFDQQDSGSLLTFEFALHPGPTSVEGPRGGKD